MDQDDCYSPCPPERAGETRRKERAPLNSAESDSSDETYGIHPETACCLLDCMLSTLRCCACLCGLK